VSDLYTAEDLADAEAKIREEFDTWGCELLGLEYAGDDCCTDENLAWMNNLSGSGNFTQCAEFLSNFTSPKEGGGAWEPDYEYSDWQWWLARTDGGEWQLITWGY
jgi:D-alanyl-D-alanine carboxypeptidase